MCVCVYMYCISVCVCVCVCVCAAAAVFLRAVLICALQVLCGNGALDSADYWAQNEKALCRLGLLDDADADGSSCTTVSTD